MTGLISPDIDGSAPEPKGEESKANLNNLLNILGYILSLATTYVGGVAGWFGGMPNSELSSTYQTLLTPKASFFGYIWAVIFLTEGFWALAQLLPRYRAQPLVQQGVGSIFFLAVIAQTVWTITFGFELMIPACISMFALLISLLVIVNRQWAVVQAEIKKKSTIMSLAETTVEEREEDLAAQPPRLSYWLLRFPFAIHAGWIAVATPLMLSVVLVQEGVDPVAEMWLAVISLPLLFGSCMGLLLREEDGAPVYAFTVVVAYACIGICYELHVPASSILERHDEPTVSLMKNLSGFCGACLVIVMVSRFFALLLRDICIKWNTKDKKKETLEIDGEEYDYIQA